MNIVQSRFFISDLYIGKFSTSRGTSGKQGQEDVKVKYTCNFNSLGIVNTNTDSNLYCKYSKQEYLVS